MDSHPIPPCAREGVESWLGGTITVEGEPESDREGGVVESVSYYGEFTPDSVKCPACGLELTGFTDVLGARVDYDDRVELSDHFLQAYFYEPENRGGNHERVRPEGVAQPIPGLRRRASRRVRPAGHPGPGGRHVEVRASTIKRVLDSAAVE
jgi:hypothetical protein